MIPTATPNIREVRTLSQSQAKFQSTLSPRHTTLNNLLATVGPTSACCLDTGLVLGLVLWAICDRSSPKKGFGSHQALIIRTGVSNI